MLLLIVLQQVIMTADTSTPCYRLCDDVDELSEQLKGLSTRSQVKKMIQRRHPRPKCLGCRATYETKAELRTHLREEKCGEGSLQGLKYRHSKWLARVLKKKEKDLTLEDKKMMILFETLTNAEKETIVDLCLDFENLIFLRPRRQVASA